MLPRVVLHNAVSVDGRIDGFSVDMGLYYGLVGIWREDATLVGSGTILAIAEAEPDGENAPELVPNDPNDQRALMVVPDSAGRIRTWDWLRKQPYWRDVVVLCSNSTPAEYLEYLKGRQIDCIVAGEDRVDLRAALEEVRSRYGVRSVRVDSGGTLNGALLRAGLVDEVSVLISPALVGGLSPRSLFRAPDLQPSETNIPLRLSHLEKRDGDHVWLRYEVVK